MATGNNKPLNKGERQSTINTEGVMMTKNEVIGRYLDARNGKSSLSEMKEVMVLCFKKAEDKRLSKDDHYNFRIYGNALKRMIAKLEE